MMVRYKRQEDEAEEKFENEAPVAYEKKAAPLPEGVLFWHRRRVETAAGPVYYDDPKLFPANAPIPMAEYARIEYPKGSGQTLKIHGARRINDRNVIAYLVLTHKKPKPVNAPGPKAGALLYEGKEIVGQGFMTEEELKDAAERNIPPDWYRPPNEPAPNFNMFPDSELDRWATQNNVHNYDFSAKRWEKIGRLNLYCKNR